MANQFLSFNEAISGRGSFGLDEDTDDSVIEALQEPMKLKDNWVLWEQVGQEGGKAGGYAPNRVAPFNTVQDFWGIWNGIPQPSELLESKRIMREQRNGTPVAIDAIMIFKEGIKPEWEDEKNACGGHFQIQLRPNVGGGQIDEYWNNLVLAMIGGVLEPSELITGIRLVDKLSGPKVANAIRIELWFTKYQDTPAVNLLRKNFENCMSLKVDGSRSSAAACKPDTKPHSSLSKH